MEPILGSDNRPISKVSLAGASKPSALEVVRPDIRILALEGRLGAAGADYARAARAANTMRAYRADWADFSAWCAQEHVEPLPVDPDDLARYLTALAQRGLKTATIRRRLGSIARAHRARDFESPARASVVRMVWAGIQRTHGTAHTSKAPLLVEDLRAASRSVRRRAVVRRGDCSINLRNLRDRALFLVGFAGAFRRSELVALELADVEVTRAGMIVTIRRSKTDQAGAGRRLGIPWGSSADFCPIKALQAWHEAAAISSGPLFRPVDRHGNVGERHLSDHAVAIIVKNRVAALGLDPDRYAGHSLRAGLATSAALADVSERTIAAQTGHKSMDVLRGYIRSADLWKSNAAGALGL